MSKIGSALTAVAVLFAALPEAVASDPAQKILDDVVLSERVIEKDQSAQGITKLTQAVTLEGCILTVTEVSHRDEADGGAQRIIRVRDLRLARKMSDPFLYKDDGYGTVKVTYSRELIDKVVDALEPVKTLRENEIEKRSAERGITFIDFDRKRVVEEEVQTEILGRVNAGEFGELAAGSYDAPGTRIQAPAFHLVIETKPERMQAAHDALKALLEGPCKPTS